MEQEKRKRGRPKGVKNGEGTYKLAPITHWKPWMTKIVIMHMAGMKAEEIAKNFPSKKNPEKFISVVRISQIIRDPQGQQMIRGMNERVKEGMLNEIESGMLVLASKSVARLAETLNEDFTPGSNAKKHQDMVALSISKNFIPGEAEAKARNSEGITDKGASLLAKALEKATQARMLHSGQPIEDADWELEEKAS